MTILHLGHQPADLGGIEPALMSTDPAGFDADLDVNAVKFTGGRSHSSAFSLAFPPPAGDLWLQVRLRAPDTSSADFYYKDVSVLAFRDASGNTVAELRGRKSTPTIFARASGDTVTDGANGIDKGTGTVHWINVRVAVGADITIELHDGAGLMSSATAANTAGKGKPVSAVFGNTNMHSHFGDATWYYAHIAVLDGTPTIGRRFARQVPGMAGAHSQWAGTLAALGDGNIATRMSSDTAGQRQSATLAGPAGPSGAAIAAVHIKAVAQAGTSGPGSLAGFLRIGGVDHDASAAALSSAVPEQVIFSWPQNPGDGAVWTDATLPAEIGLLSAP
ncbi:FscB [Roseovarius sp. E0-M6]|uniref:FscB n=1 Tax=Roseovarius sp. E0-M6 TaxID=3127118 RepID=UPI0030105FC4